MLAVGSIAAIAAIAAIAVAGCIVGRTGRASPRTRRRSWAIVLLAVAASACSSQSEAEAPAAPSCASPSAESSACARAEMRPVGPMIERIGHDATHPFRPFRFRMTNLTRDPVFVLGIHSAGNPVTHVEVVRDGGWNDIDRLLGCGDGIGWFALQPGRSEEFNLHLHLEQNPVRAPMRVAVFYRSRGGDFDDPKSWLEACSAAFVPDELLDYEALLERALRLQSERDAQDPGRAVER